MLLLKNSSWGGGLRQGDPLAPFLFLIIAENINILMEEAIGKGLYEGLFVGNDGTKIFHLQFADDAIFFGKWILDMLKNLIKILDCFHSLFSLGIGFKNQLGKK